MPPPWPRPICSPPPACGNCPDAARRVALRCDAVRRVTERFPTLQRVRDVVEEVRVGRPGPAAGEGQAFLVEEAADSALAVEHQVVAAAVHRERDGAAVPPEPFGVDVPLRLFGARRHHVLGHVAADLPVPHDLLDRGQAVDEEERPLAELRAVVAQQRRFQIIGEGHAHRGLGIGDIPERGRRIELLVGAWRVLGQPSVKACPGRVHAGGDLAVRPADHGPALPGTAPHAFHLRLPRGLGFLRERGHCRRRRLDVRSCPGPAATPTRWRR